MSPFAYVALGIALAVFLLTVWALLAAAADGDSDLLAPHPDEREPAPVYDFDTGEPICDLNAWCVSVSPDRRRPASTGRGRDA